MYRNYAKLFCNYLSGLWFSERPGLFSEAIFIRRRRFIQMDISIIIPTKNGAAFLGEVLAKLSEQTTSLSYEIIVIDSGSSDDTISILKTHSVRLFEIAPEEFSHSKTRNYGASKSAASKYLIFMNQDSIPVDAFVLSGLVQGIETDSRIKAMCAMELDREAHAPFNVSGVASMVFENSLVQGVYVLPPRYLEQACRLPGKLQRRLVPFNTVCAIFDKAYFDAHPFDPKVQYGEDIHWAIDNSNAGYMSGCCSYAKVFHKTCYTVEDCKKRADLDQKLYVELFGNTYLNRLERWGIAGPVDRLARVIQRFVRGY